MKTDTEKILELLAENPREDLGRQIEELVKLKDENRQLKELIANTAKNLARKRDLTQICVDTLSLVQEQPTRDDLKTREGRSGEESRGSEGARGARRARREQEEGGR